MELPDGVFYLALYMHWNRTYIVVQTSYNSQPDFRNGSAPDKGTAVILTISLEQAPEGSTQKHSKKMMIRMNHDY